MADFSGVDGFADYFFYEEVPNSTDARFWTFGNEFYGFGNGFRDLFDRPEIGFWSKYWQSSFADFGCGFAVDWGAVILFWFVGRSDDADLSWIQGKPIYRVREVFGYRKGVDLYSAIEIAATQTKSAFADWRNRKVLIPNPGLKPPRFLVRGGGLRLTRRGFNRRMI